MQLKPRIHKLNHGSAEYGNVYVIKGEATERRNFDANIGGTAQEACNEALNFGTNSALTLQWEIFTENLRCWPVAGRSGRVLTSSQQSGF
jgi:hypothetical protein